MSDQSPTCPDVHVELTDHRISRRWDTRKWMTRRRWFGRVFFGMLLVFFAVHFTETGSVLFAVAAGFLAILMVLVELEAKHHVYCPACEVLLGRWFPAFRYAFCENCAHLVSPETIRTASSEPIDLHALVYHVEPTVKLIGLVFLMAIKDKASQVLFEPTADCYKLQTMLNGQPYDLVPPPLNMHTSITPALKVLAGMDFRTQDCTQNGRMRLKFGDWAIDAEVVAQPQTIGEHVIVSFPDYEAPCDDVRQFLEARYQESLADQR